MRNIQMVDLRTQYGKIKADIDLAVSEVMDACQFINGPAVKDFARNLEKYLGVNHVVPCANGTDALQIALMALNLKPGDEVITTPFTFAATSEVIALLNLKPVFVDVDPKYFLMDIDQLEKAINPATKCIIPVHLFGQVCNMEAIMALANAHHIYVVEDNAQAIGASCSMGGTWQKAGTIGHIGCTSFFPSKNLGCFGDGGALFTNDKDLATKIQMIANHGSSRRYYHEKIGVNSRLDAIQAAVLNVKLQHLDAYNEARTRAAEQYNQLLADNPELITPDIAPHSTHVFHQYTIKVKQNRDEVCKELKGNGIPTGIYYPVPLHLQEAYSEYGYKKGDFPVSEELAGKVLSLPMHTELTEEIQEYITDSLLTALSTNKLQIN